MKVKKITVKVFVIVTVIVIFVVIAWFISSLFIKKSYSSREVVIDKKIEEIQRENNLPDVKTTEYVNPEELTIESLEPFYLSEEEQMKALEEAQKEDSLKESTEE